VAHEETSLQDLFTTIRRRWRLIAVVTLSLVIGATVYAERQPFEYDASAIVAVTPRPSEPNADLVRVAAPRYASYITAPATLREVARQLGEADLKDRVNVAITPDTGNITITVRHTDPRRAMVTANALANQLQRTSRGDRLVRIESIAPAVLPGSPSAPPRRLIEAAALAVGILLGVGLAALTDAVRGRPTEAYPGTGIVSVGDRTRRRLTMPPPSRSEQPVVGGYPVVGELPWSRSVSTSHASAFADPYVAEAVEGLRANLAQQLGGDLRGIVVITSPSPHQGKTTIARLLATALVRTSDRVLLVDGHKDHAEIRQARKERGNGNLHPSQAGTGNGRDQGMDWIRELWTLQGGLWVLPAAGGPVAVALTEGQERQILSEAREMFDSIIVDGPPLLDGSGVAQDSLSRAVVPLADGVLFVVSPDSTVEALYQSIEVLHTVSAPFVGVVLNRVRQPKGIGGRNVQGLTSQPPHEDPDEQ
jgi:polysaccharide biosynthesis transport protein